MRNRLACSAESEAVLLDSPGSAVNVPELRPGHLYEFMAGFSSILFRCVRVKLLHCSNLAFGSMIIKPVETRVWLLVQEEMDEDGSWRAALNLDGAVSRMGFYGPDAENLWMVSQVVRSLPLLASTRLHASYRYSWGDHRHCSAHSCNKAARLPRTREARLMRGACVALRRRRVCICGNGPLPV